MAGVVSKSEVDQFFINEVKLYLLLDRICTCVLRAMLKSENDSRDRSHDNITNMCHDLSKTYNKLPKKFDGDWNKLPGLRDRTEGADVFRIRIYRQQILQSSGGIDERTFDDIWEELEGVCIGRLGDDVKSSIDTIYQTSTVDKCMRKEYDIIRKNWKTEIEKEQSRQNERNGTRFKVEGKNIRAKDLFSPKLTVRNAGDEVTRMAAEAIPCQPKGNMNIEFTAKEDAVFGDIFSPTTTIINDKKQCKK